MVSKNLSVCLSVAKFDLNYLRTAKIEYAEIFSNHIFYCFAHNLLRDICGIHSIIDNWIFHEKKKFKLLHNNRLITYYLPVCRDSGNDFRIPEIASDNSHFSFIIFSYPHVGPSRSSKRPSVLGADFCFWSWLGTEKYPVNTIYNI